VANALLRRLAEASAFVVDKHVRVVHAGSRVKSGAAKQGHELNADEWGQINGKNKKKAWEATAWEANAWEANAWEETA
jgi:hypothetical protein